MTFSEYLELLKQGLIDPPRDVSAYFRQLKTNKRRYRFCMAMMEYYRTLWLQGQKEQEAALLILDTKAKRLRYGHMSEFDRRRVGAISWFSSLRSKDLAASEQLYCRWAKVYAAAVEVESLL